jgi:hypothetical protein
VQQPAFSTQHSALSIQHSAFSTGAFWLIADRWVLALVFLAGRLGGVSGAKGQFGGNQGFEHHSAFSRFG